MESKSIDLKTVKYIGEHIIGILPESFSYEYIFSEAMFLFSMGEVSSLYSFRAKLLNKIVDNNSSFFEKLKRDIEEIADVYLLLSREKRTKEEILDVLWREIGLNEEEKKKFLLYIKGTPFIICKDEIKERIELIRKFIDELSDEEKLVIGLYYYEGLTLREISKSIHMEYERLVIKFSLIAFKFLFSVCIKEKIKV